MYGCPYEWVGVLLGFQIHSCFEVEKDVKLFLFGITHASETYDATPSNLGCLRVFVFEGLFVIIISLMCFSLLECCPSNLCLIWCDLCVLFVVCCVYVLFGWLVCAAM